VREFDFVGTWWFYPSYLESPLGPWDKSHLYGDDPVRNWKAAIDWMARQGLNVLVSGIPPFCKDRVYHDWGYHYVLRFPDHPESTVFTKDFVEANRSRLREIFAYARRRGLKPFIHHYNFCAPVPFVKAHKELADKITLREGGRHNLQDWQEFLYGNVCWNEPVYQEYMKDCFREFLATFPDVEGIMITPGECARCACAKCRDKLATLSGFVKTFVETVEGAGRLPVVRAWATGLDAPVIKAFPKGVPYVVKYSVFDVIDSPHDPAIEPWIDAGHRVWLSKEIKGGENGGPIAWFSPKLFRDVAANSRKLGVEGLISIDNSDGGFMGMRYKVQQIPLEMFVHYAKGGKAREKEWVDELKPCFGNHSGKVFRAVKRYSKVVLNVSKLVYSPTEGFGWKAAYHFRGPGRWPGTIGVKGRQGLHPPEWVRSGDRLGSIADAVEYLRDNPWDDDVFEHVSEGEVDPISFASGLEEEAARGVRALERIPDGEIPRRGVKELALLRTSSKLALHTISWLRHWLWARVLYAGATSPSPKEVRSKLAAEMSEELKAVHFHMRRIIECALELPHGSIDFQRYYAQQWTWALSLPSRLRKLEWEFDKVIEELSDLFPEKPSLEPSLLPVKEWQRLW